MQTQNVREREKEIINGQNTFHIGCLESAIPSHTFVEVGVDDGRRSG